MQRSCPVRLFPPFANIHTYIKLPHTSPAAQLHATNLSGSSGLHLHAPPCCSAARHQPVRQQQFARGGCPHPPHLYVVREHIDNGKRVGAAGRLQHSLEGDEVDLSVTLVTAQVVVPCQRHHHAVAPCQHLLHLSVVPGHVHGPGAAPPNGVVRSHNDLLPGSLRGSQLGSQPTPLLCRQPPIPFMHVGVLLPQGVLLRIRPGLHRRLTVRGVAGQRAEVRGVQHQQHPAGGQGGAVVAGGGDLEA
mmetsp:Transcript_11941/g.25679  ORF Transcript_11941/g.25679 Transcript_11941/m.25679 type:complete len:246 (-) Transcript_11941:405-1142(-)